MNFSKQLPLTLGYCIKGAGFIPLVAVTASTLSFGVLDSVQTHGLLEGFSPANLWASEKDFVSASWGSVWKTTAIAGGVIGALVGLGTIGRRHNNAIDTKQLLESSQQLSQDKVLLAEFAAAEQEAVQYMSDHPEEYMFDNYNAHYDKDELPADMLDIDVVQDCMEIMEPYGHEGLMYSLSKYGPEKLEELKQDAIDQSNSFGYISTHVIGIGTWIAALVMTQGEYNDRRNPDLAEQTKTLTLPDTQTALQAYPAKSTYVLRP